MNIIICTKKLTKPVRIVDIGDTRRGKYAFEKSLALEIKVFEVCVIMPAKKLHIAFEHIKNKK
jgi:hypothetical protein